MWKFLQHPNVLPLIGVMMSETRFAMVSEWMTNGSINEYVKTRPDVNRVRLVGPLCLTRFHPLVTGRGPLASRCCSGFDLSAWNWINSW